MRSKLKILANFDWFLAVLHAKIDYLGTQYLFIWRPNKLFQQICIDTSILKWSFDRVFSKSPKRFDQNPRDTKRDAKNDAVLTYD